MNTTVVIGCIVGVVSCSVGVATFICAMIARAKQDGILIAKVDQCVDGIEKIQADMKEKNKEYDETLKEHSLKISKLEQDLENLKEKING